MVSRRLLFSSHKTLGLVLGLLVALQAASGAAVIFREELLVLLNPSLLTRARSTALPAVDLILQDIDRSFARPPIERVVFPRDRRTAAMVYLHGGGVAGRRVIASDPESGRAIGEVSGIGLMPFVLLRLHEELLLGNSGRALIMVEGLGLLYLIGAGLLLARPVTRGRLRVRWHGGKLMRRHDLHRIIGLSSALFLTVIAVTGVVMQVKSLAEAAPAPLAPRVTMNWTLLMPHLTRVVRDYRPQAIEDIRFAEDGRTAKILIYTNDVVRPLALDRLSVDLMSGEPVQLQPAADESPGTGLLAWMYPLHTGKALGKTGAFIALAAALALFFMPLLGLLLWRSRPRRRVSS